MSARISLMYKRSGGCNTEHICGECAYCIPSKVRKKEFICEKHGEDPTSWKKSWTSCSFWSKTKPKQVKRKPRAKKPKLKEETGGQMKLVLN